VFEHHGIKILTSCVLLESAALMEKFAALNLQIATSLECQAVVMAAGVVQIQAWHSPLELLLTLE